MLFTHKGCSGPAILSTSLYWKKGQLSIDFLPSKKSYIPKRVKQAIKNLDINLNNYTFAPAGNFGYTKAEVTKGGVNTYEITNHFESKLQKGLYFIGEVLDVTGELGGYNFQWAFSSAYVCANKIKKENV
jgi:predicted flavoprotein YhiN